MPHSKSAASCGVLVVERKQIRRTQRAAGNMSRKRLNLEPNGGPDLRSDCPRTYDRTESGPAIKTDAATSDAGREARGAGAGQTAKHHAGDQPSAAAVV